MKLLEPIDTEGAALRLAVTLFNRGLDALAASRHPIAENHFRAAHNLDPLHPYYESYLGWAVLHNMSRAPHERFQQSRRHLESAVKRCPDNAIGHYYLGRYFASLDEPKAARKHLQAALRHQPRFSEAREALDRLDNSAGPTQRSTWARLTRWLRQH